MTQFLSRDKLRKDEEQNLTCSLPLAEPRFTTNFPLYFRWSAAWATLFHQRYNSSVLRTDLPLFSVSLQIEELAAIDTHEIDSDATLLHWKPGTTAGLYCLQSDIGCVQGVFTLQDVS